MSCETIDETVYVSVRQGDSLLLGVDLDGATGECRHHRLALGVPASRRRGWGLRRIMTPTPTDLPAGLLELSLSPEQTAALAPADYDWDLQAADLNLDVRTLVVGRLRVREQVPS